jgi:hypothetical protein
MDRKPNFLCEEIIKILCEIGVDGRGLILKKEIFKTVSKQGKKE